jgi:hypothetical protein
LIAYFSGVVFSFLGPVYRNGKQLHHPEFPRHSKGIFSYFLLFDQKQDRQQKPGQTSRLEREHAPAQEKGFLELQPAAVAQEAALVSRTQMA